MTLAAVASASIAGRFTADNALGKAGARFEHSFTQRFSTGTGRDQAEKAWSKNINIAASGTDELDLAGVLADLFGATITMAAIKAVLVTADRGNTNNIVVGGAASNAALIFADATDKAAVKPGGCLHIVDPSAAGTTVTAGTGDKLLLANSAAGSAVTGKITILFEG